MASRKLSEEKLRYFYKLLSPDMLDFNCGDLCAPRNGGKPFCCDSCNVIPLVYLDELDLDKKEKKIWRKIEEKEAKELELPLEDIDKNIETFVECTTFPNKICHRDERALICRTFPFIPYINKFGELEGLTYTFSEEGRCPLVGRRDLSYNPEYIKNSIQFWKELLEIFPEDRELYVFESWDLRQRFEEKEGTSVPVFKVDEA